MTKPAVPTLLLTGDDARDLRAVARHIERHIQANWGRLLEKNAARLADAYGRAGDLAYGTYLDMVFRPIHLQLRQAGLKVRPRLPGQFNISREWGNADETDQQRWMWSTLERASGQALGTLVSITYHDHSQFRIPRAPGLFAIRAVGPEAVVKALSRRSADFKAAREASIEIAEYLASQAAQPNA